MRNVLVGLVALGVCSMALPAQTPARFAYADVHVSPHVTFAFSRGGTLRGDRYVNRQATMLDLAAAAYGLDPTNVQGGPSWLEWNRYDVVAQVPAGTTMESVRPMLQGLLADRFKLVTHIGEKPMAAWVLTAPEGKMKMTESDGSAVRGCVPQPPSHGSGPSYIVVACKNMTTEALAQSLHMFANGYLAEPVVDATGLKGAWDFEIKWTGKGQLAKAGADGISIFDAVDKQLGLKLEMKTAPRPVLVVDSVNDVPAANPAGTDKALPPPAPAQFDVAVIKPSKPDARPGGGGIRGGQVDLQSIPLKFLIQFAWDLNPEQSEFIVGAPKWLDADKFDVLAKVSPDRLVASANVGMPPVELDELRQMLKAMLIDRFQMKIHTEDRPVTAYSLIAVNPKLRKADPASRTKCTEGPGPDGKDPRKANPVLDRLLTCQNVTMAEVAEELQTPMVSRGSISGTVLDKTGIAGSWDSSFR
jgi:uncharacterized protein (TIGR03435 family)